ncbi:hypothetical protein [Vibrio sp. F74]|uniref:hypothetical protein n=1 Tax=Vibrio sp. F74 TaxID=700020 RepID=UPI0035F59190
MFKNMVERFIKRRSHIRNRQIALVGTCFKSSEEEDLLFEEAEEAIENTYHWYAKTDLPCTLPVKNGGYFPITNSNIIESMAFSQYIHALLEQKTLPVIFSNSCESFIECLAAYDTGDIGVININHRVDLVNKLSFIPMQGYASILTQKSDINMLSIGVFEDFHTTPELNLAKSMGVEWLNSTAFYSTSPSIYEELDIFLFNHNAIALNIDLRAIVRGMTIKPPYAIDLDLLLSIVSRCIHSNKVVLIQLTGDNDALIFAKEVQSVLNIIRKKMEHEFYPA